MSSFLLCYILIRTIQVHQICILLSKSWIEYYQEEGENVLDHAVVDVKGWLLRSTVQWVSCFPKQNQIWKEACVTTIYK